MRCPDCNKEVVGYNKEYCPHCGGELKPRNLNKQQYRVLTPLGIQDVVL